MNIILARKVKNPVGNSVDIDGYLIDFHYSDMVLTGNYVSICDGKSITCRKILFT